MLAALEKSGRARRGFTLVELLTVIALIITIAALAIPNFTTMLREQRVTSAISSIQVAIMRARTYAINAQLDHSVEFCTDAKGGTYLRIETESAFLENVPNLDQWLQMTDSLQAIPLQWYHSFIARRDAWGPDGVRLYSGIWDCFWSSAGSNGAPAGWGHIAPNLYGTSGMYATTRIYYDSRYPTGTKAGLTFPWGWGNGERVSSGERANNAETHGYLDVDDDYAYIYQSAEWAVSTRDNLAVDDSIYLPYDVKVVLPGAGVTGPVSTLINYDAPTNPVTGANVCRHGWDGTPDLRFGKNGYLLETSAPTIVLKRGDDYYVRLQMLRSTGRLKKIN